LLAISQFCFDSVENNKEAEKVEINAKINALVFKHISRDNNENNKRI
jgi:hypothetical protein